MPDDARREPATSTPRPEAEERAVADARAHDEELNRALDRGERELPPNQVRGILGEPGLNLNKVDEFEPDLNSGISQDIDFPVIWLAVVLTLLTVVLSPIGFVILWRSKTITHRAKVLWTVAAAVWIIGVITYARLR